MPRTRAHEKHQTPTPSGTLAHIRIDGVLHRRHFKRGTDPIRIKEWLLKTEMRERGRHPTRTGKFSDDAKVYLEAVAAMPTFTQRKQHIDEWIAVFEDQSRDTITGDQIAAQLHKWRTDTRTITKRAAPGEQGKETQLVLSAAAVNKRRTALMHLFAELDGKAERNPVRDAPKFREPTPAPRGISFAVLKKVFAVMPASKAKARLMVMAYTGIPQAQLEQITEADVNTTRGTVAVEGRRKGRGTSGRIVPLTPDGRAAFRLMTREAAWGSFSRTVVRRVLHRACKAIGVTPFRPYDLRHSFGTEVYRRTGDIRATQILLDHSTPVLTHRYTLGAVDARVQAAIDAFGPAKAPHTVPKSRKPRKKRRNVAPFQG